VISWADHGFAVGNLMTALDNAGNRVVASVTAVTTDTFTIGATVADGIVWVARVPRFVFGQATRHHQRHHGNRSRCYMA